MDELESSLNSAIVDRDNLSKEIKILETKLEYNTRAKKKGSREKRFN